MSREKADALRRLHAGPSILLFPNAWDVASARIVEQAGFPAVATSSAGVANVLGYPDGERITRAEMLDMVRRIAASVAVPVTADMEAGYGVTPEAAAETERGVIAAGAVGMDLEDAKPEGAILPIEVRVERVRASRAAYGRLRQYASELKTRGTWTGLGEGAVTYAEMQALFGVTS